MCKNTIGKGLVKKKKKPKILAIKITSRSYNEINISKYYLIIIEEGLTPATSSEYLRSLTIVR